MTSDYIILGLAVLTNVGIAFLVYYRNPKSATHRLFAALAISLTGWMIVNELSILVSSEVLAKWLVRGVMFFSVPIGIFFLLLVKTFPRVSTGISKRNLLVAIGAMIVTMGVAISPLLFPNVQLQEGLPPKPVPGIGMVLYVPVVIFSIVYGIYLLVKKFWQAQGVERVQTGYLLVGTSLMFGLIIALNFIAVNVFETTLFIPFAALFTLPFTVLTAYTIVRHRLLDIRGALFRALSLTFLVGAVLGIYSLLVIFAVPAASSFFGISAAILAGVAALISIPVARMVQKALTMMTDRFLFQGKADYGQELVNIGRDLSGTIRIEEVTSIVLSALENLLHTRKAAILLRRSQEDVLTPQASHNMGEFDVDVPFDNVLILHLKHHQDLLVKDEITLEEEQEASAEHKQELEVVKDTLEWLDVSVVMPLFVNKELTGIILLGDKLSGAPYLQDDVEFLSAFAPQAATALENARLYKESLEFGEKLKKEVDRATAELAEANTQLRNLDKAKSEFLSIASHQLRTPLTALRGYVSMLQEGDFGEVPAKQQPILDILNKSAVRLIDLINSLLDISRIERGRLELNLESVDLAQMAQELVTDLLPNAEAKGLVLEMHPPKSAVPHIVADKQRIRQVLLNFIDNSIKYTEAGRVDVKVEGRADEVVFSVTDTGKGISEADLQRLFNKFTRVGGADKYHTEGTGLGLYVAKQIMQEHHGEVFADSPGEGKGSTFSIRLPAEGAPKALVAGQKAEVIIRAAEAEENREEEKQNTKQTSVNA